jgi:hypothetical protein
MKLRTGDIALIAMLIMAAMIWSASGSRELVRSENPTPVFLIVALCFAAISAYITRKIVLHCFLVLIALTVAVLVLV